MKPPAGGRKSPRIVIVGVCAAGKTTLARALRGLGFDAHSVAQEHSQAPRLWAARNPDVVIGLECTYETTRSRKPISWGPERFEQQKRRLADAYAAAHIRLRTDGWTPERLVQEALAELARLGYYPG